MNLKRQLNLMRQLEVTAVRAFRMLLIHVRKRAHWIPIAPRIKAAMDTRRVMTETLFSAERLGMRPLQLVGRSALQARMTNVTKETFALDTLLAMIRVRSFVVHPSMMHHLRAQRPAAQHRIVHPAKHVSLSPPATLLRPICQSSRSIVARRLRKHQCHALILVQVGSTLIVQTINFAIHTRHVLSVIHTSAV